MLEHWWSGCGHVPFRGVRRHALLVLAVLRVLVVVVEEHALLVLSPPNVVREGMSAPVLSFRHVFGLKADVSSPLLFLDEAVVAFAAGHQLVLHNTQTQQQRFIAATSPRSHSAHCASPTLPC